MRQAQPRVDRRRDGRDLFERAREVLEQRDGIVVAAVEVQPRGRPLVGLEPLAHGDSLASARRCRDDDHRRRLAAQPLDEPAAVHGVGAALRTAELGPGETGGEGEVAGPRSGARAGRGRRLPRDARRLTGPSATRTLPRPMLHPVPLRAAAVSVPRGGAAARERWRPEGEARRATATPSGRRGRGPLAAAQSPAPILAPPAGRTRVTRRRPSAQTTLKPSSPASTIAPIAPPTPATSRAGCGAAAKTCSVSPPRVVQAPGDGSQPRMRSWTCFTGLPQSMRAFCFSQGASYVASASSCGMCGAVPAATRLYRLQKRLHSHREQAVEVDRAERVCLRDGRRALEQHVAGVDAAVRPEDGEAGLGLALDDRPVDRAAAAVPRQQRRDGTGWCRAPAPRGTPGGRSA